MKKFWQELKDSTSPLRVAWQAFNTIRKGKPHAYCDESKRSVMGDYEQMKMFQHNINDLYGQSVNQQVWMRKVENILKGEG